jgi:Xaa-Pro dipeptidase
MVKRREVLSGLGLGAAMAGLTASDGRDAWANWGSIAPGYSPGEDFDGRLLVNKPWAYQVMDEAGVDGVIALNPVNVFYLANYLGYKVAQLYTYPAFAVLPRNPDETAFLITSHVDLWNIANGEREYPELMPYSYATNWQDYVSADNWATPPNAGPATPWPIDPGNYAPREAEWMAVQDRYNGLMSPSSEYALARAIRESGLAKGTLAVDDWRIAKVLEKVGLETPTFVEGDNLFRRIRLVKSEVELGHMRKVAQANQEATEAMFAQIDKGATRADIDRLFMVEAAKRGAKATWIAAGGVGGLPDGEVVEGRPLLMDAVSQINLYHGDFGRTFVLGEPSKKLEQRAALMRVAWDEAFAALKPGRKYSDIRRVAGEAMKKTGLPQFGVGASPHSVGLQHTDEPFTEGLPYQKRDDLELREGMTITVDFPYMEPGWGACHLEDLVVITKDGAEALARMDGPLYIG